MKKLIINNIQEHINLTKKVNGGISSKQIADIVSFSVKDMPDELAWSIKKHFGKIYRLGVRHQLLDRIRASQFVLKHVLEWYSEGFVETDEVEGLKTVIADNNKELEKYGF